VGGPRFAKAVIGILALALVGGCTSSLGGAAAELKQAREDGEQLLAESQRLEDRFLADQANLHLWQELARRHQHVSAIAVVNHSEHVASMARYLEAQQVKAERLKRGGRASLEMAYRGHARD
jgi:hypothetical protein